MKRDVNFILLGLLITLLMSMVGMALYYQETYENLGLKHRTVLDEIEETRDRLNNTISEVEAKSAELQKKEQILLDIINELNLSKQKASSLGDYYEDVRGEKEALGESLSKTRDERDEYELKYSNSERELGVCEKDKKLREDELSKANSDITKLKNIGDILRTYSNNAYDILTDDKNGVYENIGCCYDKIDRVNESINRNKSGDALDDLERLRNRLDELKNNIDELDGKIDSIIEKISELRKV